MIKARSQKTKPMIGSSEPGKGKLAIFHMLYGQIRTSIVLLAGQSAPRSVQPTLELSQTLHQLVGVLSRSALHPANKPLELTFSKSINLTRFALDIH